MTLKSCMGLLLYECPVCGEIIKNRWGMKYHLKKYHPGLKISDAKRISSRTYEYLETKYEQNKKRKNK